MFRKTCPLLILISPLIATTALAEENKSWQIALPYTLQEDVVAKDVICNHSQLTIHAEITGQIFAVGCDLIIGQNSLLHNGIVFSGGSLKVQENADIFGDITQIGGKLEMNSTANLQGVIQRYQKESQPPGQFLNASQHYLTFQRLVPMDVEHLNRSIQEMELNYVEVRSRSPLESYHIPDFLEFIFNPDHVRFAQKWSFEKDTLPIELEVIEFISVEHAFKFWRNMLAFSNLNMSYSVQNTLGDGGHWFFRFQNRTTLLWHRKSWFFSVQSYAPQDENEIYEWKRAEATRDALILLLHKSLLNNANMLELGDTYIGKDQLTAVSPSLLQQRSDSESANKRSNGTSQISKDHN